MAPKSKSSGTGKTKTTTRSGKSAPRSLRKRNNENAKLILITLAIVLLIRTFALSPFRIPTGSMIPTLLVGDWLFVNLLAYGAHVPGTDINLPAFADPKRGDVVVFVSPPQEDQPSDPKPLLVKRCVAVPGDTILMKNGILRVNGVEQRQGYAASQNMKGDGSFTHTLFIWQKPFEIHGSRFGKPEDAPTLDNWGPMVVPADQYFMLGDNRYDSKDSRYWGFVPRKNIRGRPVFVYYSYRAEESDRPLPFITDIRWHRLGTLIK